MSLFQQLSKKLEQCHTLASRVDCCNIYIVNNITTDPKVFIPLAEEALLFAESHAVQYPKGYVIALANRAAMYLSRQALEQAFDLAEQAYELSEKELYKEGLGISMALMGAVYRSMGAYEQALKYFLQAIPKIALSSSYHRFRSLSLMGTAGVYIELKEYKEAIKYFQQLTADAKEQKPMTIALPRALNGLGRAYDLKGEHKLALKYLKEAHKLNQQIGDKVFEAKSLTDIGTHYVNTKEYAEALDYLEMGERHWTKLNAKTAAIGARTQMGKVLLRIGSTEVAHQLAEETLKECMKDGLLQRAMPLHQLLAAVYEDKRDFEKALHHYKSFYQLEKDTANERVNSQIKQMHLLYEVESTKIENKLFKDKNKVLKEQHEEISSINTMLEEQKLELEQKSVAITKSLEYAHTIQQAVFPTKELRKSIFPKSFMIYQPKEIVSGDFFWLSTHEGLRIAIVADCTGHGVPGAFMSMVGHAILSEAILEKHIFRPKDILDFLSFQIRKRLKQDKKMNDDGMDLGICLFSEMPNNQTQLVYGGAKHKLFLLRKGKEVEVMKSDKQMIGGMRRKPVQPFTEQVVLLEKGDRVYLATDGMSDLANPQKKKFSSNGFKEFIQNHTGHEMKMQGKILKKTIQEFKGVQAYRDDLTVLGIEV